MRLQYQGQEQVPAGFEEVWAFVNDPGKVGASLPDVQQVTVQDPQHFDAVVRVAVGPVRGNFKFKVELQPDRPGNRMNVKINGGGLGSVIDLLAGADLVDNGDGTTTMNWSGEANTRGPVAAVGGRVLDSQARKLIAETFANVKSGVEAEASGASG
jgi:carbon monoxide dehydrogenase subunit G